MMIHQWPVAKFSGTAQKIPRTCPGCLKPSTTDWRYAYRRPFPLRILDRKRYFQTFYYCTECSPALRAYHKYQSWVGGLTFLAFPGVIGALVATAVVFGKGGQFHEWGERMNPGVFMGVSAAIVLGILYGIARAIKGSLQKGSAAPGNPVWGPSAYYVGDGMMGLGISQACVYRASRPEWLRALVLANVEQVDAATYERVVGTPKPEVRESKPFAS